MGEPNPDQDGWEFTSEPVRGHLFVGAITQDMVDRGWHVANEYVTKAEVEMILRAALSLAHDEDQR